MPIQITCDCGRSLRAKEEYAGKRVKCPACGNPVLVLAPESDIDDDVEVVAKGREPAPPISMSPPVTRPPLQLKPKPVKASRPRREYDDDRERGRSRFAVNPSIITGLLMMLGAVVWFVVGLALGYIFFYPPVLFVLGIVAVVKGLTGND